MMSQGVIIPRQILRDSNHTMPSAHHDEPVWTMTVHYGEGGRKRTAVPGQMGVSREEIRNKFRRSTFNMLNNVEAAVREVTSTC